MAKYRSILIVIAAILGTCITNGYGTNALPTTVASLTTQMKESTSSRTEAFPECCHGSTSLYGQSITAGPQLTEIQPTGTEPEATAEGKD